MNGDGVPMGKKEKASLDGPSRGMECVSDAKVRLGHVVSGVGHELFYLYGDHYCWAHRLTVEAIGAPRRNIPSTRGTSLILLFFQPLLSLSLARAHAWVRLPTTQLNTLSSNRREWEMSSWWLQPSVICQREDGHRILLHRRGKQTADDRADVLHEATDLFQQRTWVLRMFEGNAYSCRHSHKVHLCFFHLPKVKHLLWKPLF